MIDTVIFDFDGLLVDTEIISYEIYHQILDKHGFVFTKEEYTQYYSEKTDTLNAENIIKHYHLPYTIEELLQMTFELEEKISSKGVKLKPGAKELLAYLKANHYHIALATSSFKKRAVNILQEHDILKYFDTCVFLEDVKHSKPHPEIFLKALEKLNVSNKNAIVLEDSENGIKAAINAKIDVICIPDMKIPSKEYLDKTLFTGRSLFDVLTYLQTNSSDDFTKKDEQMKIIEIFNRDPLLIQKLLEVWESSVRATHLFLSDNDINHIKEYVPQALKEVDHLLIIETIRKSLLVL